MPACYRIQAELRGNLYELVYHIHTYSSEHKFKNLSFFYIYKSIDKKAEI